MRHVWILLTAVLTHAAMSGDSTGYPFDIADYRSPSFSQQQLTVSPSGQIGGSAEDQYRGQSSTISGGGDIGGSYDVETHFRSWEYYGSHSLRCLYGGGAEDNALNEVSALSAPIDSNQDNSSSQLWSYLRLSERGKRYITGPFFIGAELSGNATLFSGVRRTEGSRTSLLYGFPSDSLVVGGTRESRQTTSQYMNFSGQIDVGVGGISNVTSAAVALNMLDRIASVNGSRPNLTAGQIQEFASYLELRHRRWHLDYREGRIENLDSINSWLLGAKVIDKESTRLTMEVLDQWDYGFNQSRTSGTEWRLFPLLKVDRYSNEDKTQRWHWDSVVANQPDPRSLIPFPLPKQEESFTKNEQTQTTFGAGTSLNYSRPWRRFWQFNVQTTVSGSLALTHPTYESDVSYPAENRYTTRSESLQPRVSSQAILEVRWYPSTRTKCEVGVYATYARGFDYLKNRARSTGDSSWHDLNLHEDERQADGQIYSSLEYYLSRNVSYSINGSIGYDDYYRAGWHIWSQGWRYRLGASIWWRIF